MVRRRPVIVTMRDGPASAHLMPMMPIAAAFHPLVRARGLRDCKQRRREQRGSKKSSHEHRSVTSVKCRGSHDAIERDCASSRHASRFRCPETVFRLATGRCVRFLTLCFKLLHLAEVPAQYGFAGDQGVRGRPGVPRHGEDFKPVTVKGLNR
jgi:hypothetical protein